MWDCTLLIGAKRKNTQVFVFEPLFFNLEFLAKNIIVNRLQGQIRIFPPALSNENSFNVLN